MRRFSALSLLMLALIGLLSAAVHAQPTADHATARLVLNTDKLVPGQQAIAAIVLDIDEGYHSQSSAPLSEDFIAFKASMTATGAGVTILDPLYAPGEIHDFPALGGKLSVYSGRVLTFIPFVVADDAQPGEITLNAKVFLQICNDQVCDRPGNVLATEKTQIVARGEKTTSTNAEVFAKFDPTVYLNKHEVATEGQPTTAPVAKAGWTYFSDAAFAEARKSGKPVLVKFTAAWCVNCHVVERRVFGDAATLEELAKRGVTLMKADLTQDGAPGSDLLAALNPSRSIPFTAVYFPGNDRPAGLTGIYSSADLFATLEDAGKTATSTTAIFGYELATAPLAMKLAVAVIVGLLLNAVPCVLPVLPLKAMSFYEDAGQDRGRSMVNGAAFSLGVIATFGGLALFVISQNALWGKFISHPVTAAILAIVLLVAAAQAFGLFEFRLPQAVTNLEARAATVGGGTLGYETPDFNTKPKLAGNFFSGVLIAVLSTPCTIGIFAAVIAVAITAGATLGSLILMFVGVGMALPWFVLSAFPEATRRFPRTGPWPAVVKQMTAFLLVATALFFAVPVLPENLRGGPVWWAIFACVAASAIFLLVRTFQLAPRPRPMVISTILSALLVVGGYGLVKLLGA